MKHSKSDKSVTIDLKDVLLEGSLTLPSKDKGIVIFAHGSGSSRFSPRNNYVASVLHEIGLGTLLFDLLTEEEDQVYARRFDIDLLTNRLLCVTEWLEKYLKTPYPLGYFGSSTGSAAALQAAGLFSKIKAVVSRGGRPDLAGHILDAIKCPVMLIVGGEDTEVIKLNQLAYKQLKTIKTLEIVAGATHLFEEPGTLEEVAKLAREWFDKYLNH
jgi:dienelactone hydrolase